MKSQVVFSIDEECDAAYVDLTPEGTRGALVQHTSVLDDNYNPRGTIHLDYDQNGFVVGIEFLGYKFRTQS
jgi:uncharacterized protein YuzE